MRASSTSWSTSRNPMWWRATWRRRCRAGSTASSAPQGCRTIISKSSPRSLREHVPFLRAELHHRRGAHAMEFAKAAAPYFPEAEVIEFHHCNKKDAPSGTAVRTAQIISDARGGRASDAPGAETEIEGAQGARGALIDGVPVHSVRSMGYVASQEVVFGSMGQTLSIRHDSWDRTSYMPGVLLGIRSVGQREGLIVGLENFLG